MARRSPIWVGMALGLVACTTPPDPEVMWQEQAWRDLDEAKARAEDAKGEPRVAVFPGHGEITVQDWFLEGYPGNAYVRARFTYENTTGRQLDWVRVWLTVMDADGEPVARQITDLFMPMGLPFNPGTLFGDELRTPTRDVHRNEQGWQWAVGCEAAFADYPGEPWAAPSAGFSQWIKGP